MFTALAEEAKSKTPANLQGTGIADVIAFNACMTEHGKEELIESLPFLAST